MQAELFEKRLLSRPKSLHVTSDSKEHAKPAEVSHQRDSSIIPEEQEIIFVTRALMWMIFLGLTPLLMFYLCYFLYPDLFYFPITPN